MTDVLPDLDDLTWMDHGACRNQRVSDWFPSGTLAADSRHAARLCDGCPVTVECLAYALEAGIDHGVWGGRSEEQRRRIRRNARRRQGAA